MLQQNMDMSQNPCEDFFKFTCGNFEKEHPRADYESSNDWFTENQAKLLKVVFNAILPNKC